MLELLLMMLNASTTFPSLLNFANDDILMLFLYLMAISFETIGDNNIFLFENKRMREREREKEAKNKNRTQKHTENNRYGIVYMQLR